MIIEVIKRMMEGVQGLIILVGTGFGWQVEELDLEISSEMHFSPLPFHPSLERLKSQSRVVADGPKHCRKSIFVLRFCICLE